MRNEDEDQGSPQAPPGPEAMIPKMQLLMEGVVVFMGDVTVESMSPLIDWILAENFAEKRKKELTLGICSRGGDLTGHHTEHGIPMVQDRSYARCVQAQRHIQISLVHQQGYLCGVDGHHEDAEQVREG